MTADRGRASLPVLWRLARQLVAGPADRRRAALLSVGCAATGGLLLAAWSIALTPPYNSCVSGAPCEVPVDHGLTLYVREPGLRVGVVLGAALLALPLLVFIWQAMRVGSAARERRLAGLALAGASPGQLRRLAALEAAPALAAGAALTLPAYLILWLATGPAMPYGYRLLPPPDGGVLLRWPVAALLASAAAMASAVRSRPTPTDAVVRARRLPRPMSRRAAIVPAGLAVALTASLIAAPVEPSPWFSLGVPLLATGFALTLAPWLAFVTARWMVRRNHVLSVLAGRRLLADVRTTGRVTGVLFSVGIAIGVSFVAIADVLWPSNSEHVSDVGFHLFGYAMAGAVMLAAAIVSAASLAMAASEQVLDGRRATAALVALGGDPSAAVRVVRWQLRSATVPAAAFGAALGSIGTAVAIFSIGVSGSGGRYALAVAMAIPLAAGVAALGAELAAALVRRSAVEGASVESLRTP